MKSWRRLKELTGFKDKTPHLEQHEDAEEIVKGMQDVQDLKLRYEGLHTVSSRVAGRAYGLSEAAQEMANFLSNAVEERDDLGQIFKEVSRVQAELSKLLHVYAFDVSETLTLPTEGLLSELDHVQAQKRQYDQKRRAYEHMRVRRSKTKSGKLEEAKEQFDELAMILGCRLHSLEQTRTRNLVTQAARHHAAQIRFFRQCLALLEDIDPFIKQVTQERHIDQSVEYGDHETAAIALAAIQPVDAKSKEAGDASSVSSASDEPVYAQGSASPKQAEDERAAVNAGSRSAPISPLRFSGSNSINSIHEVLHDGKFTPFMRTNSWMRRKSSGSGIEQSKDSPRPYSVTEPAASPATTLPRPIEAAGKSFRPSQRPRRKPGSFSNLPHFATNTSSGSTLPRPLIPSSGPLPQAISQAQHIDPLYKSGPLNPTPKMSPNSSPPRVSPPRVNELHKLPPPPLTCNTGVAPTSKLIPHTAPLTRPMPQHQHQFQHSSPMVSQPSPLPPPPLAGASSQFLAGKGKNSGTTAAAPLRKNEERVSPLPMS